MERPGLRGRGRARVLGPESRQEPLRARERRSRRPLRRPARAARRPAPALPQHSANNLVRAGALQPRCRSRCDCDPGLDALRARGSGAPRRQARLRREAARGIGRAGAGAARPGTRAGARADARAHLPLQPCGDADPRHHRVGRSGRHLLHLHEPGQPRSSPVRRQRRLGPGSSRLLDPSLLAGRDAHRRLRAGSCLHLPGDARRRLRQPRVRLGDGCARPARLARSEQAAPNDGRRLPQDDRLRRHEQRAGPRVRLRRDGQDAGDLRRVQADLSHGRRRLAHRGRDRAALRGALRLLRVCAGRGRRRAPAPSWGSRSCGWWRRWTNRWHRRAPE